MPHTPEPWYLRRVADEIAICSPHAHTSFQTIAQIYHTAGAKCKPAETDLVAMANAELLVRAPRLLKALLEMPHKPAVEEFLARHCTGMDDCAQMREELHALLDSPVLGELKKAGLF